MSFAKEAKKDTVYTSVNHLIQPKKYSGLSVMPPCPVQLQAIRGGTSEKPIQKQTNNTGLPDNLKTGVENISGFSMDNVRVHYNSTKPAQLQALAYTQGTDIHVAPGQERHLPHEAWHVVQQAQGRVKPTMQMKGVNVNDDSKLETEATQMGNKAIINQNINYDYLPATKNPKKTIFKLDLNKESIQMAPGIGMRKYTKDTKKHTTSELWNLYKKDRKTRDVFISKFKGTRKGTGETTGIRIFGKESSKIGRFGWSKGHTRLRKKLRDKFRAKVGKPGDKTYSTENSHALGHGDFGTDHYLTAPPATQFQNSEQLAIETAMREVATKVSITVKFTDIIDAKVGSLIVRRIKLYRKDAAGKYIKVFDYLMDGEQEGLTKDDNEKLYEKVKDLLSKDPPVEMSHPEGTPGRAIGPPLSTPGDDGPTKSDLETHQKETLAKLKEILASKKTHPEKIAEWRKIEPLGLAYTDFTYKAFTTTDKSQATHKAVETLALTDPTLDVEMFDMSAVKTDPDVEEQLMNNIKNCKEKINDCKKLKYEGDSGKFLTFETYMNDITNKIKGLIAKNKDNTDINGREGRNRFMSLGTFLLTFIDCLKKLTLPLAVNIEIEIDEVPMLKYLKEKFKTSGNIAESDKWVKDYNEAVRKIGERKKT